tara:strand:+ start:20170 stop:20886 length:717 start_codon:yes stop_codon:yes gene_type:complete
LKIIIITPTYNERQNIGELVEKVFKINPDYHLLVVDDNSPDGTADYTRDLQKRYDRLHLIEREGKLGLGTAYIRGFRYAIQNGFGAIVQIDADMSHNPGDIPEMVRGLANNDLILGSRYCDGVSVVKWPIRRLILSYGANLYTRIVTGMPLTDATSGFKCWKKEVLESLDLDKVRSRGYSFQIEMNFRTWHKGYKIKEIPIIFIDRTIGESKMNRSIVFEAVFMVWRLKIWKIFRWNK